MKNKVIIYCLVWICIGWLAAGSVWGEVLDGLPIGPISDPNQNTPPRQEEIIVHVQRIDAEGQTINEYDMPIRRIVSDSQTTSADTNTPAINFESLLYDNTIDTLVWHPPGALSEVYDFGTSAGGKVTKIHFGYVTTSRKPITLSVRFYSDTSATLCPGDFLGGWIFKRLDGSVFALPELIAYEYVVPLAEQFTIPAGAFGYSYQFADDDSGIRLAMGGLGNEDALWQNCQPISFSNSWAGAYMRVYADVVASEHCYNPPQFDAVLLPSSIWQTTGSVQFGSGGCRVYQMILTADQKYDFSLCSNDGVGSYCLGDGDLEMFDAGGSLLWYIDGRTGCNWAATTLGASLEGWSPTFEGTYYLRVSEFSNGALQYDLAYHADDVADPNLRVEPSFLEFNCTDPNSSASANQENPIFEPEANQNENADPIHKLILAEEILRRLNSKQAKARVIVNLQRPAQLQRKVKRRSRSAWRKLRREIAGRQLEVLGTLSQREFQSRRRYANLNSFSGAVTAEGLVKLLDDPRVLSIEPVLEVHAHLRQGIPLMNAMNVRTTYRGQGMAVAIVDTGIDYTHSALGGGGFPNNKVRGGYDFGDDDPDPFAGASHGTSCAGIAAGDLADVGDYIGGVAHQAKLYALKISPGMTGSASSDDMVAAWDWCVTHQDDDPNHPIMVISTSFGGGRYFAACDNADTAMTMAAENANAAGITVLASSGNEGWCESLAWPACIANVISVGAVYDVAFGSASWCIDGNSCASIYSTGGCSTGWASTDATAADKVTVYSNTAAFLDILAPSHQTYTTSIGGYVLNFGGTSAACPYAAGAVASLQSAAKSILGQYLTPDEVRQVLTDTGDPITDTKVAFTKPRVNLAKAVDVISCSGQALYLYNEGEAVLDVNDVITPDWITLSPEPPYRIEGGSRKRICVVADCNQCDGQDRIGVVQIYSNDPNQNSEPYEIVVNQLCAAVSLRGDFDADYDIDLIDYAHFSRYWLRLDCQEPIWCDDADLNRDGRVNHADIITFLTAWSKQQ